MKNQDLKKDFEAYNNGWNDCKAEIVKLIMEDYNKHWQCCNYVHGLLNKLLNKINKI